jgi:hypothetical protein
MAECGMNGVETPFDRDVEFYRDKAVAEKTTAADGSPDRVPVVAKISSLHFRQKCFPNEHAERSKLGVPLGIRR